MAPSAASIQKINVVYINGIQNTLVDAKETKMHEILNASVNHTGSIKRNFKVFLIWNPIGWFGTKYTDDLLQDKMELFLLKTAEEKFASDFIKIMEPFNLSKTIDRDAATRVSAYLEDMTPGDNSLETDNKITDSDMHNTKNAALLLVNWIKVWGSAIVVAHSQGNLLANLAYAKLASEYGNDVSKYGKDC